MDEGDEIDGFDELCEALELKMLTPDSDEPWDPEPQNTVAEAVATEPQNASAQAVATEPQNASAQAVATQPQNTSVQAVATEPQNASMQAVATVPQNTSVQAVATEPQNASMQAVATERQNASMQAVAPGPSSACAAAVAPTSQNALTEAVAPEPAAAVAPTSQNVSAEAVAPTSESASATAVAPTFQNASAEAVATVAPTSQNASPEAVAPTPAVAKAPEPAEAVACKPLALPAPGDSATPHPAAASSQATAPASTEAQVQALQQELDTTKELLQMIWQAQCGGTLDRTAIHSLLRRPATFEIDLAATLDASRSRAEASKPAPPATSSAQATAKAPKAPDQRFGLVSEDGIKTLFGGTAKPDASAAPPNQSQEAIPEPLQEPTATGPQATSNNLPPEPEAKEGAIDEATALEEEALRKQAHNPCASIGGYAPRLHLVTCLMPSALINVKTTPLPAHLRPSGVPARGGEEGLRREGKAPCLL